MSEPIVFRTVKEMRAWSREQRAGGRTLGLVPTMGALHEGHASLFRKAGENADVTVASIFVNPTQFAPGEDFEKYPRTFDADLKVAGAAGIAAIFAPTADFYPQGYRTQVTVTEWNHLWEGSIRSIHFDGVMSVVTKLFHATECDVAVFGQKDAQQAMLIRRMVKDLDFPLRLIIAPIVREADGLAKSSRNRYMSTEDRSRALALSRAIFAAKAVWDAGERQPAKILEAGQAVFRKDPPDSVDYFSLIDPETLGCLDKEPVISRALLAVAARYGATRLIDNCSLGEIWD